MVWIDNHCLRNDPLVREVEDVLGKCNFEVELFGVSLYDTELAKRGYYEIVDYGSREMIYDGMTEDE